MAKNYTNLNLMRNFVLFLGLFNVIRMEDNIVNEDFGLVDSPYYTSIVANISQLTYDVSSYTDNKEKEQHKKDTKEKFLIDARNKDFIKTIATDVHSYKIFVNVAKTFLDAYK